MYSSIRGTLALLAVSANLGFGAILTTEGEIVTTTGTGFGNFNTILAIQGLGQNLDDMEVGCVGRLGGADVSGADDCATLGFAGGDEKTSSSDIKTATRLIGSDFSLDDFRVILNLVENDQDVLVENLQLLVFSGESTNPSRESQYCQPSSRLR